jgi:hypothetical protein
LANVFATIIGYPYFSDVIDDRGRFCGHEHVGQSPFKNIKMNPMLKKDVGMAVSKHKDNNY